MRGPFETRERHAASGQLTRADGSGSFGFGAQTSLASVNGPIEVRLRDEITDSATLQFIFSPLNGVAGISAKASAAEMLDVFKAVVLTHHHPRTQIQVTVQTTSIPPSSSTRRGSAPLLLGPDAAPLAAEVAAGINASMMALLDGGIPMKATVVAVACAVLDAPSPWRTPAEKSTVGAHCIILDPNPEEEEIALSSHVFAFALSGIDPTAPAKQDAAVQLVYTSSTGKTTMPVLTRLIDLAADEAFRTQEIMRTALNVRS